MQVRQVRLADINVKDRVREDKGEIDRMATSIKEKGLLQPITVDEEIALVAGERRLLACRMLGRDEIWAVVRKQGERLTIRRSNLLRTVIGRKLRGRRRPRNGAPLGSSARGLRRDPKFTQASCLTGEDHSTVDRHLTLAEWMDVMTKWARRRRRMRRGSSL